jgi:GNAT superfamily N-acetyltransferase
MYIKPKFRGKKLGNLMIEKVISVSKEIGLSKLYLDTGLFMSSAVSLYKKFGFKATGSYSECIVPKELWDKWIFMMKEL